MQKLFLLVDKVSTWVGQLFAWLIIALTALICYEVFARYILNSPHPWAFDVQIMMYWHFIHDGWGLYPVKKWSCTRRHLVRVFASQNPGKP